MPAQVELTRGRGIGRGRHELADWGGSQAGISPALDRGERSEAGLSNVGFDLSQLLSQRLQLSLAGLP